MNLFIDSPLATRAFFAPKLQTPTDVETYLNNQADILEEKLDTLRKNMGSFHGSKCPPEYNEIREIRKKLSEIDSKLIMIRNQNNPEFVQYWNLEK